MFGKSTVRIMRHGRGINICHDMVRFRRNRLGSNLAAEIRKRRVEGQRSTRWHWHPDTFWRKPVDVRPT
jgi:putative transposase